MTVLMTGVQGQPLDMMRAVNLIPDLVPESRVFDDFGACVKTLRTGVARWGLQAIDGSQDIFV